MLFHLEKPRIIDGFCATTDQHFFELLSKRDRCNRCSNRWQQPKKFFEASLSKKKTHQLCFLEIGGERRRAREDLENEGNKKKGHEAG